MAADNVLTPWSTRRSRRGSVFVVIDEFDLAGAFGGDDITGQLWPPILASFFWMMRLCRQPSAGFIYGSSRE